MYPMVKNQGQNITQQMKKTYLFRSWLYCGHNFVFIKVWYFSYYECGTLNKYDI